jgi:hypothetical protein
MLIQVVKELGRSTRYALGGWSRTVRACCLILAAAPAAAFAGAAAAAGFRIKG